MLPGRVRRLPLILEAMLQAGRTEIALRRRRIDDLVRHLSSSPREPRVIHRSDGVSTGALCRAAVDSAYRVLPFEFTCLRRSIVLCRLRRRRGLAAYLRIGVRKREGRLEAHAWVVDDDGVPLTDPLDEFVEILPAAPAC